MLPLPPRSLVVLAGAVGSFIAAVGFVAAFASNCPHSDEWGLLHETLRPGFSWAWVFTHHNEHRYVLAKTVWLGLLRLTDYDFRAGMVVSLGLLAAAAGFVLATVRRVRGRWSVADLLVPALLFHWGHWFNWLMGYQIAFSLVAFSAAGFAWAVTREPDRKAGAWAAAFLGLMALNGGYGLGWGGPMAVWVGWRAWRQRSALLALATLAATAYLAFVWFTTPAPVGARTRPDGPTFLAAAATYLAAGFGPEGYEGAGPVHVVMLAAAVALPVLAVVAAGRAAVVSPGERPRAVGLMAATLGHLAVAAAVAWYRGESQGVRFVTPSAAGLVVAWLAVRLYVPFNRMAAAVVAAAAVGVYCLNLEPAAWQARFQRDIQRGLLADVERGEPVLFLAGKHGGQWQISDPTGEYYAALRDAGIWPRTPPDPPYVTIPVPTPPGLPFAVPDPPRPVFALRVRVAQARAEPWQPVFASWSEDGVERRAVAFATVIPRQENAIVFRTPPRPTAVRVELDEPAPGLRVVAVEWLAAP